MLVLIFGVFLSCIYGFGSFTFDYFAGAATAGFGVMGQVEGVGMYFTYVTAYFISLVVVLPIVIIRRFWVGTSVYLLYAIGGLFVEYYIEWVVEHTLVAPWAVVGWCVLGLATGCCADLAYRFLPKSYSERRRATLTGLVVGAATFVSVTVAVSFFYVGDKTIGPGTYLGLAYYGVPFMLISSAFGGYTAYAISKRV